MCSEWKGHPRAAEFSPPGVVSPGRFAAHRPARIACMAQESARTGEEVRTEGKKTCG